MNEEESKKKRFVTTNEDIIISLSGDAYKLYSIIQLESNYKAECSSINKKIKFFSNRSSLSKKKTLKHLNELELCGLIKIEKTFGEQSTYHFAKELNYFTTKETNHKGNCPVPNEQQPSVEMVTAQLPNGHDINNSLSTNFQKIVSKEREKKNFPTPPTTPIFSNSCFLKFWETYPQKTAKLECQKIWEEKGLDEKANLIIGKLAEQKEKDSNFINGFILSAKKYLEGERWEDDIIKPARREQKKEEEKESEERLRYLGMSIDDKLAYRMDELKRKTEEKRNSHE